MGRKFIDLKGERFGKLVVISFDHKAKTRTYWNCLCDCGGTRTVSNDHLRSGEVIDCGCYKRHIPNVAKHHMYNHRIYRIWSLMKERCFNQKRAEYPRYGGRGITVCPEWLDATTFIEWSLKNGYADDLTLDRIDNDGNYCPENCRWITRKEQGYNKSTNRLITYKGETKPLTQWAEENGFTYQQVRKRIDDLGWSFERAITEPIHQNMSNKLER